MRSLVLGWALLAAPLIARADAIEPFDGECPPGLGRAIRGHAEACVPSACRTGHDCPSGSSCETLFECWAPRDVSESGPGGEEPPRMVDQPIGPCSEDGHHCTEGVCRERRQCEPTEATPAWDRVGRRWTRTPYAAPSTCSVGARGATSPWPLFSLVMLALVVRSRR